MSLNKQKGNMYPWVTHTWNPVRGCHYNCIYCYTQTLKDYSMTPRFISKEMKTNLGKDNAIFVGSTCDMFGEWVLPEWIEKVLEHCRKYHNTYLFQSKNPKQFKHYLNHFPLHTIFGTTIETNKDTHLISIAPLPFERVNAMVTLGSEYEKMVSIEPIMDFDLDIMIAWMEQIEPKFVSIGADSKGYDLPEPPAKKVHDLINHLSMTTDVKIKDNLQRLEVF